MAQSPFSMDLRIPPGLPAGTSDKIARLAALITAGVDLPYPKTVTERVLPGHLQAKRSLPNLDAAEGRIPRMSDEAERLAYRGGSIGWPGS